ncbi:hypothetical protein [Streptomyces ipomoeae]|jgi:hypothetical protein|uniref:hypothetical protein n=1 Tax=Streptomyces ipomoeae TaxID=103232 RepID=UPI0029A58E93|nr:hypothetical protein [Streptomyces ipomoeae]MDX2696050.1 hypothetical protein [Streptomyces ipomoeae]
MVSRAKDTHTTNRVVRVPDADWQELGALVGERNRAHLIREFIAWYLRRPKSVLPKRPDPRDQRDVNAARNITES